MLRTSDDTEEDFRIRVHDVCVEVIRDLVRVEKFMGVRGKGHVSGSRSAHHQPTARQPSALLIWERHTGSARVKM